MGVFPQQGAFKEMQLKACTIINVYAEVYVALALQRGKATFKMLLLAS